KTLISIMEFNLWERMPAVSRGAGEGGPVLAAQWIASNSLANPECGVVKEAGVVAATLCVQQVPA
ncbi:hypothetical protein, partial [Stutzerimonas stutzeri]|uniref:hypothetical protein n=1 Tax=Stutzerimonas stutzeri TaxID=316 RepID=UPI001C6165C6